MRSASTSKPVALSQGLGGRALLLPCLVIEDDCLAILGGDEEAASAVLEVSMMISS